MTSETPKSKAKAAREPEESLTFEQALAEIENVVRDLESGQLGLQQSLERYEAGVAYLKQCHAALRQAERRIELLMAVDDEGQAETVEFDEEAMSLEEKRAARSRRRSQTTRGSQRKSAADDDVDTQPGLF